MGDYNGIKLYKFYFAGLPNPITIESKTFAAARHTINVNRIRLPKEYVHRMIVGESVTMPVEGVSEKVEKGIKFIWVGYQKTRTGWQDEASLLKEADAYEKITRDRIIKI